MDIYKIIKESVSVGAALKYYGLEFKRGKAICCFHSEKDPSLTYSDSKKIFKCHSCGQTGDVIAFVSRLFNIKSFEACRKINEDFRLGIVPERMTKREKSKLVNKIARQKIEANKIKAREKIEDLHFKKILHTHYEVREKPPTDEFWDNLKELRRLEDEYFGV